MRACAGTVKDFCNTLSFRNIQFLRTVLNVSQAVQATLPKDTWVQVLEDTDTTLI